MITAERRYRTCLLCSQLQRRPRMAGAREPRVAVDKRAVTKVVQRLFAVPGDAGVA